MPYHKQLWFKSIRAEAAREKNKAYLKEYFKRKKADPAFIRNESDRKKKYRIEHIETMRARDRKYHRLHPEYARAGVLRRKARILKAVHPDNDFAAERELHRIARWISDMVGFRWEVDHVIPLAKGGWHHHLNMQVLTKLGNIEKGDDPFWENPDFMDYRDVPKYLWPPDLAPEYERRISITTAQETA